MSLDSFDDFFVNGFGNAGPKFDNGISKFKMADPKLEKVRFL